MSAMFPKRRNQDTQIQEPSDTQTTVAHATEEQIKQAITQMQGSGGVTYLEGKEIKRWVQNNVFKEVGRKLVEQLTTYTNKIASTRISSEKPCFLYSPRKSSLIPGQFHNR